MKKCLGAALLALPSPVWVIGSYDQEGRPNMMPISWGGICCSKPPCLAVALRQTRQTHDNLLRSKAFTVNIPSEDQVEKIDYTGLVSGRNIDKFFTTGWHSFPAQRVDAPGIVEFSLVIECRLLQFSKLGSHTQFIGEIMEVQAEENVLDAQDVPIMGKINPLLSSAVHRSYYAIGSYLGPAYSYGTTLINRDKESKE